VVSSARDVDTTEEGTEALVVSADAALDNFLYNLYLFADRILYKLTT
jgi:hypothetical protein